MEEDYLMDMDVVTPQNTLQQSDIFVQQTVDRLVDHINQQLGIELPRRYSSGFEKFLEFVNSKLTGARFQSYRTKLGIFRLGDLVLKLANVVIEQPEGTAEAFF